MPSHHPETQFGHLDESHSFYALGALLDRLQQPSVIVSFLLLLLTIFYQSLRSSPLSRLRYLGQLLWDLIVAITPAILLYAIDDRLSPSPIRTSRPTLSTRSRSYTAKSDLLRRIFGMDGPGGIITSVADAGRRSLSSLSGGTLIKHNTDHPAGLGNYDNSCFQNSILQGLSSLEPLPSYLERGLELDKSLGDRESSSTGSLRDLVFKLTNTSYNGKTLWASKKLRSLDTGQQQDAQEYFSRILDEIEREIIKAAKPQHCSPCFETAGIRDDTEDSQHSGDSGYQSLPTLVSSTANLRNPLEGCSAQRVACVQCGHSDGLSLTPFNCITLNLGLEQREYDLYERLDSYTDLEAIKGLDCVKCTLLKLQKLLGIVVSRSKEDGATGETLRGAADRLEAINLALEEDDFEEDTLKNISKIDKRVSVTKTRQTAIARPPQSLAIHINRSVFEVTGHMLKNPAAVRFPKRFDLGPWCLGSASGPIKVDTDASHIGEERWVTDPNSSMVSGSLNSPRITGPIYELRAVITHSGRHENGHYVCYRRHPRQPSNLKDAAAEYPESLDSGFGYDYNESDTSSYSDADAKWWKISDNIVRETTEEAVLAQGEVFMLFYDCVVPNCVLAAQPNDGALEPQPNKERFNKAARAGSILIPSLAEGEEVDPMIPLRRPNSQTDSNETWVQSPIHGWTKAM
ncbi:cysteine proteinase [Hypoxylon trugodes]|uniref:cysteine proteinase n=1 Tax=Hypoxylon trugodes TaxID=326681 RepID=UPI00218D98CE|nr:cysteine proteinase [Hypoxylon trugodes]KAI1391247.1 cysteine proteinase [Hypoxylon trugodes]